MFGDVYLTGMEGVAIVLCNVSKHENIFRTEEFLLSGFSVKKGDGEKDVLVKEHLFITAIT